MAEKTDGGMERDAWSHKLDFVMSLVGYCIGLGNAWRFPYLCYENGGGAFLVPYLITLVLAGTPMFILESSLGQMTQSGVLGCWKMCPIFKGVGYGVVMMAFWLNCYYIIILSWAGYYLYYSFTTGTLAWHTCDNAWNTVNCGPVTANCTNCSEAASPEAEFWERQALGISSGVENPGSVQPHLAITLLVAWIATYFCIWKGVKWTGKIVWVTASLPYVLLVVLFFRAITLPGASIGIQYYIWPDPDKLLDGNVWKAAASQMFFSHGLGVGAVLALGSYNKYRNNVYRDSILLSMVDVCTALFAGFVIFATIGYMAHTQNRTVPEVAKSGPGLAFLAYPAAVAELPFAPIWAIAFFTMIILLGLDSQFCTVEGFVTALVDEFPQKLRRSPNKEIFIAITCAVSYLIGLTMVTEGGVYVFQLFDFYSQTNTLLFIMLFECVAICWSFGIGNYYKELEMMLGFMPCAAWKFCWCIACPLLCLIIGAWTLISYEPVTYTTTTGSVSMPWWAHMIGWCMSATTLMPPFVYAAYLVVVTPGDFRTRVTSLFRPPYRSLGTDPKHNPDLVESDFLLGEGLEKTA